MKENKYVYKLNISVHIQLLQKNVMVLSVFRSSIRFFSRKLREEDVGINKIILKKLFFLRKKM